MRYYRTNLLLILLCISCQMSITFDAPRARAYVSAAVPANFSTDSLYPAARTLGSYWLNGMNLLGQTTSDVLANLGSLSYKGAEISFDAAKKLYEIGQIYLKEHPETAQPLTYWRNIGLASLALPVISKFAHIGILELIGNEINNAKKRFIITTKAKDKETVSLDPFSCQQNPLLPCSYQLMAYLLAAKEVAAKAPDDDALKTTVFNVIATYRSEKTLLIPYSIAPHSYAQRLFFEIPYIKSLEEIAGSRSGSLEDKKRQAVKAIDWLSKYWAPSIPDYIFKRLKNFGSSVFF